MKAVFLVGSQLSRAGLKGLLTESGFSPSGEAGTLLEAHRVLCGAERAQLDSGRFHAYQLLLIDLQNGLDEEEEAAVRAINRNCPAVKMAVLGDARALALLSQKCPTEIDGYLLADMSAAALGYSLHLIM